MLERGCSFHQYLMAVFLSFKHPKSKISVYYLKNLTEVGFQIDVAQSANYGETVATKAAVTEILQVILSVAVSSFVCVQVTGGTTIIPERISESLGKTFFPKVVCEHSQTTVGHL